MELTVRDVAKLLHVSEKTIYRWLRQRTIPAYRVNDQYRFQRSELLDWATSRRIQVAPQMSTEPEGGASQLPGFDEAIRTGGIYYRIEGTDKESALRSVAGQIRIPEGVDRDYFYQVLLAREELASTAIGRSLGLPHPRNPLILDVSTPSLALTFLEHEIDWGALDGRPVRALFIPLSATVRAHLHLLSRLSFALQDSELLAAIDRQGSREEIIAEAARVEQNFNALAAS